MVKPFSADYLETIGADFATKRVDIGKKNIRFQIWDIAGQPNFASVRSVFYKGALGGLLVFDITRHSTFENAQNWLRELWMNSERGKIPVVVLGNKIDLRDTHAKAIPPERGDQLAKEFSELSREAGFEVPYLETSALTRQNVDRAFLLLGEKINSYIEERLSQ